MKTSAFFLQRVNTSKLWGKTNNFVDFGEGNVTETGEIFRHEDSKKVSRFSQKGPGATKVHKTSHTSDTAANGRHGDTSGSPTVRGSTRKACQWWQCSKNPPSKDPHDEKPDASTMASAAALLEQRAEKESKAFDSALHLSKRDDLQYDLARLAAFDVGSVDVAKLRLLI